MKKAIVVGQSNSDKCLIAKFNDTAWAVDTSFPDITGILWGCYTYLDTDIWVCGGTGADGMTAPILYHYNGISWTDYASDITDATWFYSIAGNGSDCVYVSGIADTADGGVWYYDGSWTSTKQNTGYALGCPNGGGQYPHIAVDDDGYAYTANWIYISSNKADSTWALFRQTNNSQSVQIRHAGSNNLVVCSNEGTTSILKYTSSINFWSFIGPSGAKATTVGANSDGSNICFYRISDTKVYKYVSSVTTAISTANHFSNGNRFIYADDDLWTCGSTHANGTWDSVSQLSKYQSGTTWSGPTDYNVDGLDAAHWYDISGILFEIGVSSLGAEFFVSGEYSSSLGVQFISRYYERLFYPARYHNTYDEHGESVGISRLKTESNWEYKRRIFDTFVHRANSSYQGLIHGITRELGLSLFNAITISPKKDSNGDWLCADPYIKFDNAYLLLYDDYTNNNLAWAIDRYQSGGNYEHIYNLVNFINSTTLFEASINLNINEYTKSMSIINQSNRNYVPMEFITQSTKFQLKHFPLINGLVFFSNRKTFKREVATEVLVNSRGDYFIDYMSGIITVYSVPNVKEFVRYTYTQSPLTVIGSPIILHDINSDQFKIKLFEQVLQDNNTYEHGLPTELGVDIINELISITPMYWGI